MEFLVAPYGAFFISFNKYYILIKIEVCSMLFIAEGIADIVRVLLFFVLSPLIVVGYMFLFFLAVIIAIFKPGLINKVEKRNY